MTKKMLLFVFSTVFSVLFIGCASYKPQMVRMEPMEAYHSQCAKSDICIAVEPYDNSSKAKSAFYIDVTQKSIKPIQVVIDNKSNFNILITRSQIRLVDRSGNEYQPVNSKYVFSIFEKNELMHALFGFGIFSYMAAEKANEKMQADWYDKELPEERTVISNRKATGFVFFETGNHLQGLIVEIDVLNLQTNDYIKFEIPIT
jgi:hypothetical protein